MDITFIYRSLRLTLFLTFLLGLTFLYYFGYRFSLGIVSGSLWNAANIFLFIRLSQAITQDSPRKLKIFLLALIKFAGLYAAGYCLIRQPGVSLYGICLGFSLFFTVVFLKSIGTVFSRKGLSYVRP